MSGQGHGLPARRSAPTRPRLVAGRAAPDAPGGQSGPIAWYLRSLADGDTHRGSLTGEGIVVAICGAEYPLSRTFGGKALPGQPPDAAQICQECQRKVHAMPPPRRDP